MDVNVHIATNNDKVCRIMVCDANTMDEASIRIRFNVLCEQFKNSSKYCSLSEKDPKLKEDENISYEMTVHKNFYVACKQSHVVRNSFYCCPLKTFDCSRPLLTMASPQSYRLCASSSGLTKRCVAIRCKEAG